MELFDTLKECVRVAQQADNVPLVRELINAQTQVLDLVDENQKLREQIKKMQETTDIAGKIERHEDAYITLADDPDKHIYCSCCWDTKKMLVQGQKTGVGTYRCPSCGTNAYYDKAAYDKHQAEAIASIGNMTAQINRHR